MYAFVLTVCLFMADPSMNKCYDFAQEYDTIELCNEAGANVERSVLKSPTVVGTAFKCTPLDKA